MSVITSIEDIHATELTCREICKLFTLEAQGFLVTEQIRIVERRLVHELQRLCDKEHRKDRQINFPAHFACLSTPDGQHQVTGCQ